ncbi:putative F-box/LRR-repeat protein At3g18150 [Syzygium oleosum]|uniref:putative F-box/LRR-repeat protein At3g18150 n=1 Tax=Syzygium oleosum TaxID=219896 RepID=UPI0024B939DF|nr:putative F-box/LRR-repeat protein At3g18150 [Syzygium oleosum]
MAKWSHGELVSTHYCGGVKNIVIDSTSVKELKLVKGHRLSDSETIWAPHLLSLRVSGIWRLGSVFRLDDVSSLVEAELDFVVRGDKSRDLIKELLEKLHGVSTITIGSWCLEVMSALEMEGVPSPLSKCQNLILRTTVSQRNLPGIAYMLRSSQCMEKLVIDLTDFRIFKVYYFSILFSVRILC